MGLRHHNIIDKMDLEQKCALLSGATGFGTRAYPDLGIPELQFSDGPHGMRHQDPNAANHLGIGGSIPATCFPTAVTVANSWDPALAEELGRALGEEAVDQGVNVVLGPGLCIKRSPLCGRNFEYLSEDPLLAGKMDTCEVSSRVACPPAPSTSPPTAKKLVARRRTQCSTSGRCARSTYPPSRLWCARRDPRRS